MPTQQCFYCPCEENGRKAMNVKTALKSRLEKGDFDDLDIKVINTILNNFIFCILNLNLFQEPSKFIRCIHLLDGS